jgi:hypothetical protein
MFLTHCFPGQVCPMYGPVLNEVCFILVKLSKVTEEAENSFNNLTFNYFREGVL